MWLTYWWTTSTKLSFITEEGVSLWFQCAHLLNSCSVWILFFSSAQVLTAVASSHGQLQPGPQLSRQLQSGISPARYLPLNYFSSRPLQAACGELQTKSSPSTGDFQQCQRGSTWDRCHTLWVRISAPRGNDLFLGSFISVLGMVAATCICYFWYFIENKWHIWERDYFWTEEKGMGDVTAEILIICVMFNKLSKGEYWWLVM